MELSIDGYSNIINENFKEFCGMEEEFDEDLKDSFFEVCKKEVISNIIVEFGINDLYSFFKDGGNIGTVYNAEKGIFTDEKTAKNYNAKYKDVENKYRDQLPKKRKEMFQREEKIISYGTGETLEKDGSTHLDHVISAKNIYEDKEARLYMSQEDIGQMAQSDINLKPLESNINQSKGEHFIEDWSNKKRKSGKTNEEHFKINKDAMIEAEEKSNKFIKQTISRNKYKKIGKGCFEQGSLMVYKETEKMLVIVVLEFVNNLFHFTKKTFENLNLKNTLSEKISCFKKAFIESVEVTKEKISIYSANITQRLISSFGAGAISGLVTFLINRFTTTIKGVSKIINDSIHSLIRAFKIIVTRPNGITKSEAVKEAVKIVSTAITASIGVILSKEIIKFLQTTPLNSFAEVLGSILGLTLTGILSGLIIYIVDNFRNIIKKVGEKLNSIVLYSTMSIEKLEKVYQETLLEVDEFYHEILNTMYKEYEKIEKLRDLAYDFNALASMRHRASIEYAAALGVDEIDIIKDEDDLYNFLNN